MTARQLRATSSTMHQIGIRELRQNASRYLREVEAGATIEVTDRGRPVARLTPVPVESELERLYVSGRITRASRPWDSGRKPRPQDPGRPTASEVLAKLREDER
jgi:prevent-host-death family protein